MGSVSVMLAVMPCLVLLYFSFGQACRCSQRISELFKRLLREMLFNGLIAFVDASLLVIATCSWINLYQISRQAIGKNFSFYASICLLSLLFAYLFTICFYLLRKRKKLTSKRKNSVTEKIGVIYSGYKVGRSPGATIVTIFCSALRRLLLGLVLTYA